MKRDGEHDLIREDQRPRWLWSALRRPQLNQKLSRHTIRWGQAKRSTPATQPLLHMWLIHVKFQTELPSMSQDDATTKNAFELKKFFGDELRLHPIATNRVKCVTVLSILYQMEEPFIDVQELSAWSSDADDFGFASVDEDECQQIMDELLRLNIVKTITPSTYNLSDRVRVACDTSRCEFGWNQH